MILFPAVDLKGGKAVRLRQGRAYDVTVFADNPLDAALRWQENGAQWLHLVDLDGAFDGVSPHTEIVRKICQTLNIPVQLGGGIRSLQSVERWLDAGVNRLIIGTMALENPAEFATICHKWDGLIGVSLDAQNGRLKTRGWVQDSGLTIWQVLPRLVQDGAAFLIYTDIERDGMRSGVNMTTLRRLTEESQIPVLAAGGVATLDDIKALYSLGKLAGVITGRAIYEGTLDLRVALDWIAEQKELSSSFVKPLAIKRQKR